MHGSPRGDGEGGFSCRSCSRKGRGAEKRAIERTLGRKELDYNRILDLDILSRGRIQGVLIPRVRGGRGGCQSGIKEHRIP